MCTYSSHLISLNFRALSSRNVQIQFIEHSQNHFVPWKPSFFFHAAAEVKNVAFIHQPAMN